MRVILYARANNEEDLPAQLAACRAYAQAHGFEVATELSDAMSGNKLDRPGLTKVRRIIRQGGVDALIVAQPESLTRNAVHMGLLRDELQAAGAILHIAGGNKS